MKYIKIACERLNNLLYYISYGKTFIQNNVIHALEPSLSSVDSNIREIRESRNNRSSACREMERLQGECRKLITEVHSM